MDTVPDTQKPAPHSNAVLAFDLETINKRASLLLGGCPEELTEDLLDKCGDFKCVG